MNTFATALIYLATVALSCALAWLALRVRNKVFSSLVLILAVLPVTVICGIRDISVGEDTPMYMEAFEHLLLGDEWAYSEWIRFEPGFKLLYQALASVTSEISVAFFLLYGVTFLVALVGFILIARRDDVVLAWDFYLLLCMLPGCNVMRQVVMLSFALLACGLYRKRHLVGAVIALLIGCSFHNSGYFFLAFLPILFLSDRMYRTYVTGLFVMFAFFTPAMVILLGYGAYLELNTGVGIKSGMKTALSLLPFLCILKCDYRLRPDTITSVGNKKTLLQTASFERLIVLLLIIQIVSLYSDWSLRLTLNGLPFVALMMALVIRKGSFWSKSYCILFVIYQFGYLCMACNDNACNRYLIASGGL